jgi:hypothetical protein
VKVLPTLAAHPTIVLLQLNVKAAPPLGPVDQVKFVVKVEPVQVAQIIVQKVPHLNVREQTDIFVRIPPMAECGCRVGVVAIHFVLELDQIVLPELQWFVITEHIIVRVRTHHLVLVPVLLHN